jgi:hypothetical protein
MTASDTAKDSLLIASGIINAALPDWVTLLPQAAPAIEAGLRITVGLLTIIFLFSRIVYYRRKTSLLNRKNAEKDDE